MEDTRKKRKKNPRAMTKIDKIFMGKFLDLFRINSITHRVPPVGSTAEREENMDYYDIKYLDLYDIERNDKIEGKDLK